MVVLITTTPSWVEVTLDTRPPKVRIAAVGSVDPPADWEVLLTADEDIGGAEFLFHDSLSAEMALGYESVDDRTLLIAVPTVSINGPLTLRGLVWDEVGNTIAVEARSFVQGLPIIEVDLTLDRAYAVDLTLDRAYGMTLAVDRAYGVGLEIRDA